MIEYGIGDVVYYFPFGAKVARKVQVTEVDVHKGRAAFSGREILAFEGREHFGQDVWGYESQVVRVVRA